MDGEIHKGRWVCDFIDLCYLAAPVVRPILSTNPVIVVVQDIASLVTYLQSLLYQRVVALRAIGTVAVEGIADITHLFPFAVIGRFANTFVDGVNALADIGFGMFVYSSIGYGISWQRICVADGFSCLVAAIQHQSSGENKKQNLLRVPINHEFVLLHKYT